MQKILLTGEIPFPLPAQLQLGFGSRIVAANGGAANGNFRLEIHMLAATRDPAITFPVKHTNRPEAQFGLFGFHVKLSKGVRLAKLDATIPAD
jgi:hypothetical protein